MLVNSLHLVVDLLNKLKHTRLRGGDLRDLSGRKLGNRGLRTICSLLRLLMATLPRRFDFIRVLVPR